MNTREALKALDKLEETHFESPNLEIHHKQHVAKDLKTYLTDETDELFDPISKEEYDANADKLSKQPVYTSDLSSADDVVGFVTTKGRIVKYKKSTKEMVAYIAEKDNNATISYYRAEPASYMRKKRNLYAREIKPDDDFYNR